MELNCKLVKIVSRKVDEKTGKEVVYKNFALRFPNGDFLPILLKSYDAKNQTDKEKFEKINYGNWIKFDTLAVLEEDEK